MLPLNGKRSRSSNPSSERTAQPSLGHAQWTTAADNSFSKHLIFFGPLNDGPEIFGSLNDGPEFFDRMLGVILVVVALV